MSRTNLNEHRDTIILWVNDNVPKREMCRRLHCDIKTLNRYLTIFGIEYHGKQGWSKGLTYESKHYMSFEDYVSRPNVTICTDKIRRKLLREGLKEAKCERCGNVEWEGQPIPLEVHHVNGDKTKNDIDNLQLLCPNCHALTDTYRGRNVKKNK